MMTANIIRLYFAFIILALASYQDIRYRKVKNIYWILMGVIAIPFLFLNTEAKALPPIFLTVVLSYALYLLKEMRAADTKAIWALALLLPEQPFIAKGLPLFSVFHPPDLFPFILMLNALLLATIYTWITKNKKLPFIPFLLAGLIFSLVIFG